MFTETLRIAKRALRIVYRNNSNCFDELINRIYNIHRKNIQTAIELYKIKNNLSDQIIQ